VRRGRRLARRVLGLLTPIVVVAAVAAPASANPGDVYALDFSSAAVIKVSASGGNTGIALAEHPGIGNYSALALGPDGYLYVGDLDDGQVYRLDRATGATTLAATFPDSVGVWGFAFDLHGRLVAVDEGENTLTALDLATGRVETLLNAPGMGFGDLVFKRDGSVFIAEDRSAPLDDRVVQFANGSVKTVLTHPDLDGISDVSLSPDERYLYATSFSGESIIRRDLETGATAHFEVGFNPRNIAFLRSQRLVVSTSGELRTLPFGSASSSLFSADPDLITPFDLVVDPPSCAGRTPTVVGTDGRDVIEGSRFVDVVATLGGRDTVRGLEGRDVVCGGGGKDKLRGGKGKDRLIGGPGRDRLSGGKGKDRLRGQGGRDKMNGGRGKDSCRGGPRRDTEKSC